MTDQQHIVKEFTDELSAAIKHAHKFTYAQCEEWYNTADDAIRFINDSTLAFDALGNLELRVTLCDCRDRLLDRMVDIITQNQPTERADRQTDRQTDRGASSLPIHINGARYPTHA